jgi:glycosyltransferase involved in cell wall biosynthesis
MDVSKAPGMREIRVPYDNEIVLRVPAGETASEPLLSVVIPAMDEEAVVGEFLDWCRVGINKARIAAEIIIIDSSSDRTGEIALARGARVLRTPRRGLGRAYIDAIPFVRGRYVLMGDADCTYDFRELSGFVEKFEQGCEFIMGSRFTGAIEPGAMPALHRYFGTPLTGAILNLIYGTHFSDIHCGMRGATLAALRAMRLQSRGWEYASEMLIKAVRLGLRTAETPVNYLRDRPDRVSHHRRAGWLSPWAAGWTNLKAMLVGGADFFLIKPGLVLLAIGFGLMLALVGGPIAIGRITLSLNAMMLALTMSVVGLQACLLGGVARSLYDLLGRHRRRWLQAFSYTRTTICSLAMFIGGLWLIGSFVVKFIDAGYTIPPHETAANHRAVFGLFMIIAAFQIFMAMLLMHGVAGFAPLPEVQRDLAGETGRVDIESCKASGVVV